MTSGDISVGKYVIFQDQGNNYWIKRVESKGTVRLGKMNVPWNIVLRANWGSTIRCERGEWIFAERIKLGTIENAIEAGEAGVDNRNLNDDNNAQTLTNEEISNMKKSGEMSTSEIISAIANASSTFKTKTVFAQEKYLKKKQIKHIQQVTIYEPSPYFIIKAANTWGVGRTCCLRTDTLGALLGHGNIRSGSRALVLDHSQGILVGAVAQVACSVPNGRVFVMTSQMNRERVSKQMNLGAEVEDRILVLPETSFFRPEFPNNLSDLVNQPFTPLALQYQKDIVDCHIHFPVYNGPHVPKDQGKRSREETEMKENDESEEKEEIEEKDTKEGGKALTEKEKEERYHERWFKKLRELEEFTSRRVHSFVCTINLTRTSYEGDYREYVNKLYHIACESLLPDGRLVILSANIEPLTYLSARLQASPNFICVRTEEFFYRHHQILPERTHPNMNKDSRLFEGLVVSAIRVLPSPLSHL